MNIAIFGDSFADEKSHRDVSNYASWPELLRLNYNYNIDNFAIVGSSQYYNYSLFYKVHKNYDKIIYVSTFPGRQLITKYIEFPNDLEYLRHSPNKGTTDRMLKLHKSKISTESISALKALSMYYSYLYDDSKEKTIHKLLIKRIFKERPDVIFIDVLKNDNNSGMHEISEKERITAGIDSSWHAEGHDNRMCHLTPVNNRIFSEKVHTWIKGSPIIYNLEDFQYIPNQVKKYFYKL